MLLIAVLVAALACVVVGVVISSVALLIVSLALSVLAAGLLLRLVIASRRRGQAGPAESANAAPAPTGPPADSTPAGGPAFAGPDVLVVDGRPDYHRPECDRVAGLEESESIPLGQALEDGFAPCEQCRPPTELPAEAEQEPAPTDARSAAAAADIAVRTVWVADGYPEYHVADCGELAGLDVEPVPYDQAVEDGFQPCIVCNPDSVFGADAESAPTPFAARAQTAQPDEVWVADGYPAYHRQDCADLAGLDAEPIPREQAVEDGFTPCDVCRPDSAQVWVADGYPDYHRGGCAELTQLDAEPIPREQAVEDGFAPCPVCRPDEEAAAEVAAPSEPPAPTPESHAPSPESHAPSPEPHAPSPEPHAPSPESHAPSPESHAPSPEPAAAATPAAAVAVAEPEPAEVWVADGYPEYHRAGCAALAGLDSEPIPHDQAVEDGFAPCTDCRPDDAAAADAGPQPVPAPTEPDSEPAPEPTNGTAPAAVSVVKSPSAEPHSAEPHSAEPHSAEPQSAEPQPVEPRAGAEPPAGAAAAPAADAEQVWVVDGRPRYHTRDCLLIKDQNAQPVPEQQAAEDGFLPCSVCRRAAS